MLPSSRAFEARLRPTTGGDKRDDPRLVFELSGSHRLPHEPKLDISAIRAITSRPAGSVPSEILDAIHRHEVAARRRSRTED
jgi:hypothetical protein